jgi:anthranilate synthase component II
MILVIDNYDSFTYNLVQMLATLGAGPEVYRSDAITAEEAAALRPAGVVISPGPCGPADARNSPDIVRRMAGVCPVLGVCLGHQVIADVFGATVGRAPQPVHGKVARVSHDSRGVFTNVPSPFEAARYHSLMVIESSLPPELEVTARSEDGVIMGLRHATLPVEGVQFHPESILTTEGETILSNFLRLATHPTAGWAAGRASAPPATGGAIP